MFIFLMLPDISQVLASPVCSPFLNPLDRPDRCRIEIEQRAELNFFEHVFDGGGGSSLFHSFFLPDEQLDISKLLPFVSRKNRIKTRA